MGISSIRGAITIEENTKENIIKNTTELLEQIIYQNDLKIENIINILFTATKDITKEYPAVSARQIGITQASLMCLQEMDVENSLEMCIRVMLTVNTEKSQSQVKHIYLKNAKILRPDICFPNKNISIAIDGPAGSGKSTIAKEIAKELSFIYIDTGAMYRSVAYYCLKNNINFNDFSEVIKIIDNFDINLKFIDQNQHIFLNDEDITEKIRTQEIGKIASITAKIPEVREKLISIQRQLAKNQNIIMDGRDIGTNVLPNANVKIYMEADIEERALRRFKELQEKGGNYNKYSLEEIKEEILQRDFEDKNRDISPLRKAQDAILLNTTNLTIQEVKNKIIKIIKETIK